MIGDDPVVITVCVSCGEMRSILWLNGDRWYCRTCRSEGSANPQMYPVS